MVEPVILTKRERTNAYAELIGLVYQHIKTYEEFVQPAVSKEESDDYEMEQAWELTPVISTQPFTDAAFRDALMMWSLKQDSLTNKTLLSIITRGCDERLNNETCDGGESAALSVAGAICFANHQIELALSLASSAARSSSEYDMFLPELTEAIAMAAMRSVINRDKNEIDEMIDMMSVLYQSHDTDEFWEQFE